VASCSTNGHLNFNAELLGLDEALWDYVIVHERLHFCVPNHGRLWKSLMQAHLGTMSRWKPSWPGMDKKYNNQPIKSIRQNRLTEGALHVL
jgi:predicted metal-dependent hydrolase